MFQTTVTRVDWLDNVSGLNSEHVQFSVGSSFESHGYLAAGKSDRRFVYISEAFGATFPKITETIHARSKWRTLDAAGLAAIKHRFTGARRGELWALVTSDEFNHRPAILSNVKYVMFEKLVRLFILKTDAARSKLNVCEQ